MWYAHHVEVFCASLFNIAWASEAQQNLGTTSTTWFRVQEISHMIPNPNPKPKTLMILLGGLAQFIPSFWVMFFFFKGGGSYSP